MVLNGLGTVGRPGRLHRFVSHTGTGSDSRIPHTYEWTYEPETTNYSGAYPYGWCLDHGAGPCAQFFGGQTSASPYALMWQWSGGGGATNGIGGFNGDLDTIDAIRQN